MKSISSTIVRRIRAKGKGWVFTPKDFLDVGSRASVDQTLSRLVHKNLIRRLSHGIYDYPKTHDRLGILSPSPDSLAQVVAKQTGDSIMPSGARAANWLGLSTQVPAKSVYLTTGYSKQKKIGNTTLIFRHTSIPPLGDNPDKAALMVQALLYIGKDYVDDSMVARCAKQLSPKDRKSLGRMASRVPDWMVGVIHQINTVAAHG